MLFREGQIKPYVIGKYVQYGKILKVNEKDETYTIEDLKTKEVYIVDEDDVFLGDD